MTLCVASSSVSFSYPRDRVQKKLGAGACSRYKQAHAHRQGAPDTQRHRRQGGTRAPGIIDLETNQTWKRAKPHGAPYSRDAGRETLAWRDSEEGPKGKTKGLRSPSRSGDLGNRWMSRLLMERLSLHFHSYGGAVFNCLRKIRLRLGRRNDEAFEEI